MEKIPLNTPLEEGARFRNQDNMVFFTSVSSKICVDSTKNCTIFSPQTLVTTVGMIDQAFKLYRNLPLPPVPGPDPHAISHIIISRLKLTGNQSIHGTHTHTLNSCVCLMQSVSREWWTER